MNANKDSYALELFLDPTDILEQMKKDKLQKEWEESVGDPMGMMNSEDFNFEG